jgi:hypothetical protein
MKLEEQFIKKLETYLDEDFNDYTKKRIYGYLMEYREAIPLVVIKPQKEEKEEKEEITIKERMRDRHRKEFITQEELLVEAHQLCEDYDVSINDFVINKSARSRNYIGELRKKFCSIIHEKYLCSNMVLSEFFNVHHSTISHYLYGKTSISRTPKSKSK